MKTTKRLACLAACVLMCAPVLTACGGDSQELSQAESSLSAGDESSEASADPDDESSAAESSDAEDPGSKTESSKTEDKNKDKNSKPEASSKTDSKTESSNTESKPGGGNASQGGNNNSAGGNQTPAAPADPDPEEDDPAEAQKPTKYIYLRGDSVQYDGEGIEVAGNQIRIGKGGTYEISGTLNNGQIYIATDKKKVKLHLNNASITNAAGSAINCQQAKKLTITTLPGTVNSLTDGGNHDEDKGTIFTEDTIVLNGEGTLNITANFAHGVQSDDDIVINGGTVNIRSAKSCLHSNDGITINGGYLYCDGGTNGIKTDGFVTVTGGSSVFLGGSREEKGAIYCDGAFTVTGGRFWAIGNTCTTPDAATTTANVIGMMFPNAQPAESVVNVVSGGNNIFTMTSPRSYKYVVYAGPDLITNAEYRLSYGGTVSGGTMDKYVWNGATYEGGTDGGSFTAGNTVTFYTVY